MIEKFSGTNYKAFEHFNLEFRALTILLGSNSTGKSAIVNSLLMLSQSANPAVQAESALRLNGAKTGMGEALNIITDKEPDNELSFEFTISENSKLIENYTAFRRGSTESYIYLFNHISSLIKDKNPGRSIRKSITLMSDYSPQRSRKQDFDYNSFSKLACTLLRHYRVNAASEDMQNIFGGDVGIFVTKTSITKIEDCLSEVLNKTPREITPVTYSYRFKYNTKEKNLQIIEYIQRNSNDKIILKIAKSKDDKLSIESEVYNNRTLQRSRHDIYRKLNLNSLNIVDDSVVPSYDSWIFSFLKNSDNPFASLILGSIAIASRHLLSEISPQQINHVSPLRAFPQRYYLLDKTIHHKQLNALEGTELAEVLKNNPKIRKSINRLFAKFNIAIDVEKVNDIIHKIVVTQDSVRLELTDVGFGISQVLPILVQAHLSPENSLTIIEQPEIHLHPNMQAWLADALIDIALTQDKKFLIETHSDALIRRLRLRILDNTSSLTQDEVKIYHLHRTNQKNRSKLEEIQVTPNGDIRWPLDFMDAEINDTLEIQRLKSQRAAMDNDQSGVTHG